MFFFFFCLNSLEIESEPQTEEEIDFLIDRYIVDVKLFSSPTPLKPHYKSKLSMWDKRLRKYFKRAVNDTENINLTTINFLVKKRFPPAIHLLGEMNEIGYKNITRNLTEAYRYYEIGAKLGYPLSLSSVAFYKRYGIVTERNVLESLLYDDIGAQLMSTKSIVTSSLQYSSGKYRPKSNYKAINSILKIATSIVTSISQDVSSIDRIGHDLSFRTTVNLDDEYILPNLESMASSGNEEAEIDIGVIKYFGKYGQKVDKRGALEIFSKHKNNPRAQALIGKMFHDGDFLPKNITKAKEYYKKAGDQPIALFGLGRIATEENKIQKALEYYEKANLKGESSALYNALLIQLEKDPSNQLLYNEVRKLAADKDIPQGHLLVAAYSYISRFPYDEELIVHSYKQIISQGPWLKNGEIAKTFVEKQDYNRSVLIYMELAEMGMKSAAYNAGMIFLMNRNGNLLGFNRTQSIQTAIRMFKLSLNPNSDKGISQLLKCYELLKQKEKAVKTLPSYCSTLYCNYTIQKWSPDTDISSSFEDIKNAFLNSEISIITYLSYQIDSYINEIHKSFDQHDFKNGFIVFLYVIKCHLSTFTEIATLLLLIYLVRKRVSMVI